MKISCLLLSLVSILFSCSKDNPDPVDTVDTVGLVDLSDSVAITSGPAEARQGDVVDYMAETYDVDGNAVIDSSFSWSVNPASAGLINEDGRFVGYTPGSAWIVASASSMRDSVAVTIAKRGLSGDFDIIGHSEVSNYNSSHIWVHGSFAYTGTLDCWRSCGNRLLVWDISDPTNPILTDEVIVGGNRVNDVMVRTDGTVAAMTHEGEDGGIIILDLNDPAHPEVIPGYKELLEGNTHNLWIDGDYIYVASTGFFVESQSRLSIVDISNLQSPVVVDTYYLGSVGTHDIHVNDGLAVISHWGGTWADYPGCRWRGNGWFTS